MAKHTTSTAKEFLDKNKPSDNAPTIPAGFEDMPELSQNLSLQGWIRPAEDMHVFGHLLTTLKRKAPRKNQAEEFLVIELAAPVTGLILGEDRSEEAEEGTLNVGDRVGLDMRQGVSMLRGATGKVHIHFQEKVTLEDGNTWWRCKVSGTAVKNPETQPQAVDGNGQYPQDTDNVPF